MRQVWRLILRELGTQDWRIWIVLPLPLIVFFRPVETLLGAGPYAAAIALTAYFVMLANNHRKLVRKPDRGPEDRPPAGHKELLAKYAMTFIWFLLAAFACNAAGAAPVLFGQTDVRLSSPEELAVSLSVLLLAAGICLPLHILLKEKFIMVNVGLLAVLSVYGPSALPDVPAGSPLPMLALGLAALALSYWPAYLASRRGG
jgi:hypothetical protein